MKRFLYILISIIIFLTGPGLIIIWQLYVAPNWGSIEVIEAAKIIPRGAIIAAADLKTVKVKTDQIVQNSFNALNSSMAKNYELVQGKEATIEILPNQQITKEMVDIDGIFPNKSDDLVFALPTEWIMAKPGSLLRGDRVSLIIVDKQDVLSNASKAKTSSSDSNQQNFANSNINLNITSNYSDIEAKLTNIPVSYVKSSNNQEVTSDDRKKTTGTVNNIEIMPTPEQRQIIIEYGKKGCRFIVGYR